MILNDVYILLNYLIRGTTTTNADKKILAINEGYKYLQNKMYEAGKGIEELLVAPANVATTISTNYVSLPTNFAILNKLYYKSGSNYLPFETDASRSFKNLLEYLDMRFYDTSDTGEPQLFAIKRPYIYFDFYFASTTTDGIKISYYQIPTTLVAYDRLTITGATGAFTVGETITGGSSEETATVYAVGTGYVDVISRTGTFSVSETLTGRTSSFTAVYASMTEKPQVLEVREDYKLMLATAAATVYLFMEDSPEGMAKNATLEALIQNMIVTNDNDRYFSVEIA